MTTLLSLHIFYIDNDYLFESGYQHGKDNSDLQVVNARQCDSWIASRIDPSYERERKCDGWIDKRNER